MEIIAHQNDLAEIDTLEKVERLQAELLKLPQYEPLTEHTFHGGMYCRQVWQKAGVLVVGKVHRKEHFFMIVKGTMLVNGSEPVEGPMLFCSMPGTKRALLALTDALCVTFHRTDAKTVEQAEAELVDDDPSAAYGPGNRLKLLEAA